MTAGGVYIGSCAEEEREVMKLVEAMEIVGREDEMNRVGREDAWGPGTMIPGHPMPHFPCTLVTPLHPHLFDHHHNHHVQNGYGYASAANSPVYARRPTVARFAHRQSSQQPVRIVKSLKPPIQLAI